MTTEMTARPKSNISIFMRNGEYKNPRMIGGIKLKTNQKWIVEYDGLLVELYYQNLYLKMTKKNFDKLFNVERI